MGYLVFWFFPVSGTDFVQGLFGCFSRVKPTMGRVRFRRKLVDESDFIVCVELTGGPDFNYAPIGKFLRAYQDDGSTAIPKYFDFTCVTLPQNPGGIHFQLSVR